MNSAKEFFVISLFIKVLSTSREDLVVFSRYVEVLLYLGVVILFYY